MRFLYIVIAVSLLTGGLAAQGIDFHDKWKHALKEARKEDKLIFVDAYTTWCGPCKWMTKNVFTDEAVANFYNAKFVNIRLDMEKGEGVEFADEYDVRVYPTLLFINTSGAVVYKRLGAVPADVFLEIGKEALDPSKRIEALSKRYEEGDRSPELMRKLIEKRMVEGISPQDIMEEYFSTAEGREISKENFELIHSLRPEMHDPAFQFVLENLEGFREVVDEEKLAYFIVETCIQELKKHVYSEDRKSFDATIDEIKSYNMPYEHQVITYGKMEMARSMRDYDAFVKYGRAFTQDYVWDDWNVLNTIAWYIYEDEHYDGKEYVDFALEITERSMALDQNYYNTDTYAALLYKKGKYGSAMKWAEKAIEIAKSSGTDYSETTGLIKKIKWATKDNPIREQ